MVCVLHNGRFSCLIGPIIYCTKKLMCTNGTDCIWFSVLDSDAVVQKSLLYAIMAIPICITCTYVGCGCVYSIVARGCLSC